MGINPVARSDSHPNLTTATVRCSPRLNPFSVTLACPSPFGMTLACPERISDRSGGVRSIATGSFRCLHIVHPHSTCHVHFSLTVPVVKKPASGRWTSPELMSSAVAGEKYSGACTADRRMGTMQSGS